MPGASWRRRVEVVLALLLVLLERQGEGWRTQVEGKAVLLVLLGMQDVDWQKQVGERLVQRALLGRLVLGSRTLAWETNGVRNVNWDESLRQRQVEEGVAVRLLVECWTGLGSLLLEWKSTSLAVW